VILLTAVWNYGVEKTVLTNESNISLELTGSGAYGLAASSLTHSDFELDSGPQLNSALAKILGE
jgi:hypothetical protein